MAQARKLLTKVTVGACTLDNRVMMAPMTRGRASPEGVPTPMMVTHYEQRAGAGLIVTEATGISRQGLLWHCAPGIWTDEQVEGWKPVVKAVHDKGGKIALQLWHMGRQGHSEVSGMPIVAPSPIALKGQVSGKAGKVDAEVPHELTKEEILATVEDYGTATANAAKAGFDMVEVHNANGYLADLFLQSSTNKRTDEFGGSLENRLRFMQMVLDRVVKEMPADRVGIRFSPNGAFGEMGSPDNIETVNAAIKLCAERGLAYVHVMDGLGFGFHELHEPYTLAHARKVVAETGSKTAIVGNVGYDPETAEKAVASGDADMIAIGRPYMSNPDLVERIRAGVELDPPAEYPFWWDTSKGEEGYTTYPAKVKA